MPATHKPKDLPHGGFELYRDRAGEHRWRLWSRNGRVLADSGEGYTRKASMVSSARRFVRMVELAALSQLDMHPTGVIPRKSLALDVVGSVQ